MKSASSVSLTISALPTDINELEGFLLAGARDLYIGAFKAKIYRFGDRAVTDKITLHLVLDERNNPLGLGNCYGQTLSLCVDDSRLMGNISDVLSRQQGKDHIHVDMNVEDLGWYKLPSFGEKEDGLDLSPELDQ